VFRVDLSHIVPHFLFSETLILAPVFKSTLTYYTSLAEELTSINS